MGTLAVIRLNDEQSDDVMTDFAGRIVKGIREVLYRTVRGTGELSRSIRAQVYGKEIVVQSDTPYAKTLDQGTRSRVMWSLINRVVPIKLRDGTTIFRRVTAESIRRGKWRVSPHQGLEFVEKGVELARAEMSLRAQLAVIVQTTALS
jgi:hypothetical protein